MPSAVGSPPTPFVDGAAVSAPRDKPLEPIQRTKATAAISILRRFTLSLNDSQRRFVEVTRRFGRSSSEGQTSTCRLTQFFMTWGTSSRPPGGPPLRQSRRSAPEKVPLSKRAGGLGKGPPPGRRR